jgi:glucosylceramidase
VAPERLYEIHALSGEGATVHLEWQSDPNAEGYEVFTTPNLDTPFAAEPVSVKAAETSGTPVTKLPAGATSAFVPSGTETLYYAVASVIGGRLHLDHTVLEAKGGAGNASAFEVTDKKTHFKAELPPQSIATYTWTPGAAAVQWWETSRNGGTLSKRLMQQPSIETSKTAGKGPAITLASKRQQSIDGFGGALTDSSAYLINHSSHKAEILEDLFGADRPQSADFKMVRLPLGASDLTANPSADAPQSKRGCSAVSPTCYAPNPMCFGEVPPQEPEECFGSYADKEGPEQNPLEYFSIKHDERNIIPVLQAAKHEMPSLGIIATPWSAPGWMKTSRTYLYSCAGREDFLGSTASVIYARYLADATKAYEENGLPFKLLSIQNEPQNCKIGMPTMRLEPKQEAEVANALPAQMKKAGVKSKPTILGWDHNFEESGKGRAQFPEELLELAPKTIGAIGYHSYEGLPYAPGWTTKYPKVGLYLTESSGEYTDYRQGDSGANLEFEVQHELIDPLRDGAKASLYWNLALDDGCGPQFQGGEGCEKKTSGGGCGACRPMITVDDEHQTVVLNEDFYYWAQFSRFIESGAARIETNTTGDLDTVAFENPNKSITLVVLNTG